MIKLPAQISKFLGSELDQKKIMLILMFSAAIIYLDFTFILKAQLSAIGDSRNKIIKIKKDMSVLTKELDTLTSFQRAQKTGKAQGSVRETERIVSEEGMPQLLQDISAMADKERVRITQIKPFRDPKAKEESYEGKSFIPITITLLLSSDYHSLGSFINSLENAGVFVTVHNLKVAREKENLVLESVTLVLKTYVAK